MGTTLANWLREIQPRLLPRWIDTLAPVAVITNGAAPDDPELFGGRKTLVTPLYDGLVAAAAGDHEPLQRQLLVISNQGEGEWPLAELLASCFDMRRIARELLIDEGLKAAETLALLDQLDQLVETMAIAFSRERIRQADFLAASLAQATEEADRAALQLSALNEVSQQLSASLEVAELTGLVGEKLMELLGVAHISIWLGNEQDGLRCAQSSDATDLTGTTIEQSAEDDLLIRSYREARHISIPAREANIAGPWYQQGCGVAVFALLVQEHATGVVVLQDPEPEQLSRQQLNLARAITNQAAIALENARLYEQIRRFNSELELLVAARTGELQAERDRLSTLHDIAQEVNSTLDLDALLETSLAALARITNAQHGSVLLLEADTGHLVSKAVLGDQSDVGFTRFPIGVGIAGWVAQQRRPALVPDVSLDERWVTLPNGVASRRRRGAMLAVPLMAQSEVMGVLTLSHTNAGFFNEDHLRLLAASAVEISMGIHNANLYNEIVGEMERRAELVQQLERNSGLNVAILQSLSDGVLVCDADGRMLTVNFAAETIMQRDWGELLIANLHELLDHLADKRANELPLRELLARPLDNQNQPRRFQSTFQIGTRTVSVTLGPVMTERQDLVGAFALLRDITREVEADRLKTEFIGTMSHELRTPMTSIKGFTQLLTMGSLGPVNDAQRDFLRTIHVNAERMISIINDVLDITKIETGNVDLELRPLHVAESISSVVADLQSTITAKDHTLTIGLPPDLPLVAADARRLHQVLHNLISNAVKYTPRNGHISIEAHEAQRETLPASVVERLFPGKRYVQVDIRDTGVGIAPEDQPRIFERFYRTENPLKIEAGGTGLGLSLVRPLIELSGGNIWLASELNQGSSFSFVLPAA